MTRFVTFYRTSVGKKVVMAVSGAMLSLFLVVHLVGNLLIFAGPEAMNGYSAFLKKVPEILWPARIALALALILHIIASAQVTWTNWRARPIRYAVKRNIETDAAARTMIYGGPLIFAYALYHLLMFTFLTTGPGYSHENVYQNVVLSFRVPAISIVYIVAMGILGFHLYHGVWSMFQTLGAEAKSARRWLPWCVAIVITGGFILIPVFVMAGLIGRGI
jgi:succinate dehydrogenase / fumarate reductase cytochrome b subunit